MKAAQRVRCSVSVLAAILTLAVPYAVAQQPKSFPSYQAAATALVDAVRAKNSDALKEILGNKAEKLLSSGDATADENSRKNFLARYDQKHNFSAGPSGSMQLTVGSNDWPLPFPIVKSSGEWHFDADAGAQEMVYRRIGRNELDAIKVCKALATAQKEYAASGHDGDGPGTYAQKLVSSPGKEDGLYWEVKEGEATSPAGELVADASAEGYQTGKRAPFHGYYYKILTSQGAKAPGGAKSYLGDGRMTGGFAILAWPAEYRASGVMTFAVNTQGTVKQKDLGTDTEDIVKGINSYDPDVTWAETQ